MAAMSKDGLSKLAALMGGGDDTGSSSAEQAEGEQKLLEDVGKVLQLVVRIAGDNLFDQQILIEECAQQLRDQIREELGE